MQRRGPGAKTSDVEACVALVCASTDDGRPFTGGTNSYAYQKRQKFSS